MNGQYKDSRSFYQQNGALCRRFQAEWEGKAAYASRPENSAKKSAPKRGALENEKV